MIDQAERIRELEGRLVLLEAKEKLSREADDVVERAIRDHLPLVRALDELLPLLLDHSGAQGVLLHTYDERLVERSFLHGRTPVAVPLTSLLERTTREVSPEWLGPTDTVIAQRLDVAGEGFGCLALSYAGELGPTARSVGVELMSAFAEELDNYLASIARAREKVAVTNALSEALRHPILATGIDQAIGVLRDHVAFDDLLLVFRHDEERLGRGLQYKIIQDGLLTHDSHAPGDMDVDEFIRTHAAEMIHEGAKDLVAHFGISKFREEIRISGTNESQVLGRLVLTTRKGEFNTYDRDLVERFVDFLERRIVDFNKEWKTLSVCFPEPVVHRLLREPRYRERFLAPREMEVAVMFCDISGFTRLSEQVLKEPALIGNLIDVWGRRVVDIVWETGGVFDKMVGDCVIGLWGPPFGEWSPSETCRRAAEAALRIRDYTRRQLEQDLPMLRGTGEPIGVATGLNHCPLHVGVFGPDEDYTGFSSGMNNTARLQGVATRDEVLCMDRFVTVHGDPSAFGDEGSAKVKNVEAPLRYRPLRG
jgi:adenylate cyclase